MAIRRTWNDEVHRRTAKFLRGEHLRLDREQKEHAQEILATARAAWSSTTAVAAEVTHWVSTDNGTARMRRAMRAVLVALNSRSKDVYVPMALVGNLVLSGSRHSHYRLLEDQPGYLDYLLSEFHAISEKTPAAYGTRECILWDCILMGVLFPYYLGINRASLVSLKSTLLMPRGFRFFPQYWHTFAAVVLVARSMLSCHRVLASAVGA